MSEGRAAAGSSLASVLGVGSILAEIPRIFLEIYRMRRDGTYYDQQDYLAKLRRDERTSEVSFRLMEHELIKRQTRAIENSPFDLMPDEARQLVRSRTSDGRQPALLIAPFARDPDAAGKPTYRPAIAASWRQAEWREYLKAVDGLIVRPLHRGDVDLDFIRQTLAGLPVVLINGVIQSDRRIWPEVVTWNLIDPPYRLGRQIAPDMIGGPIRISLPMLEITHSANDDSEAADLAAQDRLSMMCTLAAGMLGDWFRTVQYSTTPALHKLLQAVGDKQLAAKAGSDALDLAMEYGRLDRATARVEQAQICAESNLLPRAVAYVDKAIAELKVSAGSGTAMHIELQRRLIDIYDMVIAKTPRHLDADQMTKEAVDRDKEIHVLRDQLWHRTLGGLGWDDPSPGRLG